nr:acyltransferase [Vibrio sp. S17_S38]
MSGFVLAWASRDGIKENYYMSRIVRIYPAYLFMGLITIPFILEYDLFKVVTFIWLFITSTQSWLPSTFSFWNFGGSWSISTEMFFYLVFPFVLPFIKKKPVVYIFIAYIITSFIIPISLLLTNSADFPRYYVSPIHRLPEFVIGVGLGVIFTSGGRIKCFKNTLFLLAILGLVLISPSDNQGWMKNNYVTVLGSAYIVYFLAEIRFSMNIITKIFVYLGKISFSFYLMQLPILMFVDKYNYLLAHIPTWQAWSILGLINLCMACFCYHFVENNKKLKYILKNKKTT